MKDHKKRSSYNPDVTSIIIRCGLAAIFTYAAIEAFRNPVAWISFVPSFSTKFISAKTALDFLSVFQLVLAAWLITGRYLKFSAVIAAGMLLSIVAFNYGSLFITFRDIGLAAAAISLIFLEK